MFDQEKFNDFVVSTQALKLFPNEPVVLKSGMKSRWYVNWRSATASAVCLGILSDFVIGFCADKGIKPHCFYGVPEGATKLATVVQMKWALAHIAMSDDEPRYGIVPMGRGTPKKHGDPKDANYVCAPQGKMVVLEDVATTAGSLIAEIKKLQSDFGEEIEIIAAIVLTDRCMVDVAALVKEECGVDYYALSSADKLIPAAFSKYEIEGKIKEEIIAEYNANSIRPLVEV